MNAVLDDLSGWARFFGLLLLGWVIPRVVTAFFRLVHDRVDRALPDDMPRGAGAWLVEQSELRGLSLRVFGGEKDWAHIDAYIPSAHTVVLAQPGDKKRDASYWAVAAHELGHALVYRRIAPLRWAFAAARVGLRSATTVATTLIVGNILYARRDIDAAAFTLLEVSLVAYVVVLLDELLASTIAVIILLRDGRVDRRGMIGGAATLFAALATYLGGFVGQVVLVAQRGFVVEQIERHRHFEAGDAISGVGLMLAGLLSVFLLAGSVIAIARAIRTPTVRSIAEAQGARRRALASEVGRSLLGLGVVWLLWDQSFGPLLPLFCVAAVVAARPINALVAAICQRARLDRRLAVLRPGVAADPDCGASTAGWEERPLRSQEATRSAATFDPEAVRSRPVWHARR